MSIDYDPYLVVGFVVYLGDMKKALGREMPEQFHMERRFDPKTGERLADEKVIDVPAGIGMFLDGKEIERLGPARGHYEPTPDGTFMALEQKYKKKKLEYFYNEASDVVLLGFSPKNETSADESELPKLFAKAHEVGEEFKEIGLIGRKERPAAIAWLVVS